MIKTAVLNLNVFLASNIFVYNLRKFPATAKQ